MEIPACFKNEYLIGKDFGDAFRALKSLNPIFAEMNMFASYTVMDELLYYLDRICVPHNGALKKILIQEHHEVPFAAHPDINKTYRLLSATYFWPQMQQDVIKYLKACHSCQIMEASRQLPQGLLQPLPVPKERWESISMDFITTLPCTTKGNAQILVIVDRFSKMTHFIPCKKAASAQDIASLFVQHIFRMHGLPRSIISDRDPKFIGHFWTSLFKSLGTNLLFNSAYHPQTDGQTERVNQILEEVLQHYIQQRLASWEEYLPLVEFYNNTPHSVTAYDQLIAFCHWQIDHIFLTRICAETAGGLPGLLLTLAGINEVGMTAQIWGPGEFQNLVNAIRCFVPSAATLHTHSFGGEFDEMGDDEMVDAVAGITNPIVLLENELVKISAVVLQSKQSSDVPKWKGATRVSVIYICELTEVLGKFDPKKALARGLRPGPKYGKLQKGESVISDDGRQKVNPEDVLGPSSPGPIMMLVDCPDASFLHALISIPSMQLYCSGSGKTVNCIVHLSPPSVTSDEGYQKWMEKFSDAHHLMAGRDGKNPGLPILKSSANQLSKLNFVCPDVFPMSGFLEAEQQNLTVQHSLCKMEKAVSVENLLKSRVQIVRNFEDCPASARICSRFGAFGKSVSRFAGCCCSYISHPQLATDTEMENKGSPMCKSTPTGTKATFMITNKRITQVEKEMKEWKSEMKGWWKMKANFIQILFNEGSQWKKEKEDLRAEVHALQEEFRLRPVSALGLDTSSVPENFSVLTAREQFASDCKNVLEAKEYVSQIWKRTEVQDSATLKSEMVPECVLQGERDELEIVFLGTGSSQPSKYRNVSGIYLHLFGQGGILLDCGEGTYAQLKRRYGSEVADGILRNLKCVWISHIHADHHAGLPRLLSERKRLVAGSPADRPIFVIGPKSLGVVLRAYEKVAELAMVFLDSSQTTTAAGTAAEALKINERNKTSADGVMDPLTTTEDGLSTMDQSDKPVEGSGIHLQKGGDGAGRSALRDMLHSIGLKSLQSVQVVHCLDAFGVVIESQPKRSQQGNLRPGWKLVYSGDTRPCHALVDASHGATVLIHEATFDDSMPMEAISKNHSITKEAIEVGMSAGVYRTILTHFSQRYPKIPVFDESYTNKTCIAFDMMSVNLVDLPLLPRLLPALKMLFQDEMVVEDEDDSTD
ncbi:hypothetical protein L7F22_027916 [Adiantum nelumboides]|nr:hypothetical protein [Adiantum nelumboides]